MDNFLLHPAIKEKHNCFFLLSSPFSQILHSMFQKAWHFMNTGSLHGLSTMKYINIPWNNPGISIQKTAMLGTAKVLCRTLKLQVLYQIEEDTDTHREKREFLWMVHNHGGLVFPQSDTFEFLHRICYFPFWVEKHVENLFLSSWMRDNSYQI